MSRELLQELKSILLLAIIYEDAFQQGAQYNLFLVLLNLSAGVPLELTVTDPY